MKKNTSPQMRWFHHTTSLLTDNKDMQQMFKDMNRLQKEMEALKKQMAGFKVKL